MGRISGQAIIPGEGAEFFSGSAATPALVRGEDGSAVRVNAVVGGIGEATIGHRMRRQGPERVMHGAPKFWKVTNRAQEGHVKVWRGVFNGEVFPDGADPDDKTTWLQAGDSMMIPLDAALHFFGNVFDPRTPEAMEIIERYGGFELETQKSNPGKNAEVRVIGGPIGLPDFVIEPIDGRLKAVGQAIELYQLYWTAVKKRVLKVRKDHDPSVIKEEQLLLAERIREYTLEEDPEAGAIFDGSGRIVSTTASREEKAEESLPDMKTQFANGEPLDDEQPAETPASPRPTRAART